jgi:hypothetical protein
MSVSIDSMDSLRRLKRISDKLLPKLILGTSNSVDRFNKFVGESPNFNSITIENEKFEVLKGNIKDSKRERVYGKARLIK